MPRSRRPKAMLSSTLSHGNRVYDWNTMPRSEPGPVTTEPSSKTRPSLALSRPAMIRSKVDLPQPEGPKIVMKSLSATSMVMGSRASVGAAPLRAGGKARETASMQTLLMGHRCSAGLVQSCQSPREQQAICSLEQEIGNEPDQPDHDDSEDYLTRVEKSLTVYDHVPNTG